MFMISPFLFLLALCVPFESITIYLVIIGLIFCECGVMWAQVSPYTLTSESDWLEDLRTTWLPALRRREEHLFLLMDSRAEKQKQPKPTHTSRLTGFDPHLVDMCITSAAMAQHQAKDTAYPLGARLFRRYRAMALKELQELQSQYKRAAKEIESEIQECEAFLLKPTLPSVPQPEA